KLIAGITAAYAGEDVNVAADMAAEAVRWNSTAEIFYYNELEEIKNDTDGTYAKEQLDLIKNIPNAVAQVVKANDITIISFNIGMIGYAAIINNKNGNVWMVGVEKETSGGRASYRVVPEVGINLNFKEIVKGIQEPSRSPFKATRMVGRGISINFGNIGGRMDAVDIDRAIQGSSIGIQACYGVCGGAIRTSGRQTILTYGVGNPQISITGGNMIRLTEERKQDFFKILGIRQ
ncbi:hypothetical protein, partial [Moraxella porci]|uniref:hypothetical protein n=1 Tax=Moraxella porci TaxID=1288392 RepID=UPI002448A00D